MSARGPDRGASRREPTEEVLRSLLPSFFWLRDAERGGGTLEALIAALAHEYGTLRHDVAGLYEDLFIATCRPEIIPYIGAGVGVTGLGPVTGPGVGNRAWVGQVVGLRRSKGTLATAARATSAATGWALFVQDGREVTAHTQSVIYPRPSRGRLADVSRPGSLRALGAPWSTVTRGVSLAGRLVGAGTPGGAERAAPGGYPGPLIVRVAVWRLQSFPVMRRTPKRLDGETELGGRAFTFHPAGIDAPLFSVPQDPVDRALPPAVSELPVPLTIADLEQELATRPAGSDSAQQASVVVWGRDRHSRDLIPLEHLKAGDLRHWRPGRGGEAQAIVDPELGRLLFTGARPDEVAVSYAYGSPGELGGGPYGHASSYAPLSEGTHVLHVGRQLGGRAYSTIEDALLAAAELPGTGECLVLIDDSATYTAPAGVWRIPVSAQRTIRIASSPEAAPVLEGDLEVQVEPTSRLELSGVMVLGQITMYGDGQLAVEHSTLAPGLAESVLVAAGAPAISLAYAIVGAVDPGPQARLAAANTIVDGRGRGGLGSDRRPIGELDLRQVTVLGSTDANVIVAEDCIFTARVQAVRPQAGLVRRSFVPVGSTPEVLLECEPRGDSRLLPRFTSTQWGDPAYGQLDLRGPKEIAEGATRNGEMGAWGWLQQPSRFARLPVILHEMLPAGVLASVEYSN